MADFTSQFQSVSDFLGKAAQGLFSKLDHFTFKMLVDNLKSTDYDVATSSLEQLEKEGRKISIAPVYFVSQAHPNMAVRARAMQSLRKLVSDQELRQTIGDKPLEEATKALIIKYGNYKQ